MEGGGRSFLLARCSVLAEGMLGRSGDVEGSDSPGLAYVFGSCWEVCSVDGIDGFKARSAGGQGELGSKASGQLEDKNKLDSFLGDGAGVRLRSENAPQQRVLVERIIMLSAEVPKFNKTLNVVLWVLRPVLFRLFFARTRHEFAIDGFKLSINGITEIHVFLRVVHIYLQ